MDPLLTYLDVALGSEAPNVRTPTTLSADVVKSSPILTDAADYYLAVTRLAINCAGLPHITPEMANDAPAGAPPVCTNGLDLAMTVTCAYYTAAGVSVAGPPRNVQLIKDPSEIIAPLALPEPAGYAFMNWGEFIAALNRATSASFADLTTLEPTIPKAEPSFALNGQFLAQVLPSTALFDWGVEGAYPRVCVEGNAHLLNYVRGLALHLCPNNPPERSVRLTPECTGLSYRQAPDAGGGRTPVTPAPFTSTSVELVPSCVGARTLQVRVSGVPVTQEVAPGVDDRTSILTDFLLSAIDVQNTGGVVSYVAGSGLGTARWIKLKSGPVQSFRVEAHWTDDRGRTYPVPGGWGKSTIKLGFAHRSLVQRQ